MTSFFTKKSGLRPARAVLAPLVIALTFAMLARGAGAATMDSANRAFAEGHYADAASQFERIVAENGYSAPLLFDLGNTYLRGGKPVRAIIAYERAELLAPHDEAIRGNLSVARSVATSPDPRGVVERVADVVSVNAWTWVGMGAFWVTVCALGLSWMVSRRRRGLLVVAMCGALIAGTAAAATAVESRVLDRGIVVGPAPVLVSPFESAESDFSLPAGSTVELGKERPPYVFIHDARGRTGWVERTQLEPVVPGRS